MVDRQISFNSHSKHVSALRMAMRLSTAMIIVGSSMMVLSCHGFSINGSSISNQPRTTATRRISSSAVPWISDHERRHQKPSSTSTRTTILKSSPSDSSDDDNSGVVVDMSELQAKKTELISACQRKPSKMEINALCNSLEKLGEQLGVGQGSSYSGLMGGEWELLYSPEDVTRSSPFFWAFRQAFPDQSDDIFSITDSIPSPIKEVGPATQTIELTGGGGGGASLGTLVSRVKVATLGGLATSIMTTRTTIVGVEGLEGLRLKIETTKPEDSTILKSLGPFGETINANSPPFPSGEALEKVKPGSSEVVMKTTYCDETLRISRNGSQNMQDAYVWRRTSFGSSYQV